MANIADRTLNETLWTEAAPRVLPMKDPGAWVISRIGGLLTGGRAVGAVDTLASSFGLLWGFLPLFVKVVALSSLSRVDVELATLRTAWNTRSRYEWFQHVYASRLTGFAPESVERVVHGPDAPGWTERQRLLLTAVDELHADRMISQATWDKLREHLSESQIADLCMLVGKYEMLAMLLKSAGTQPEPQAWQRGPLQWLRREDDSDRLFPQATRRLNKLLTNRVMGRLASAVPPYAMITHTGRKSGKQYHTPVGAYRRGNQFSMLLPYGDKADWIRNLRAAGGGEITYRRTTYIITNPRIVDTLTAAELDLPVPTRLATRLMKVLVVDLVG